MNLYRTERGIFVEQDSKFFRLTATSWDELICNDKLLDDAKAATSGKAVGAGEIGAILPPVESQEVWAAGVTYYRSRNARMEESKIAGGGDFYERVYEADRPELFFKATARRVVGTGAGVRIRSDAKWSVPEPELTLMVNSSGHIFGYTVGNDMSSRDIEGENPLYLPQAKVYDGSCALGPCVLLATEPLGKSTAISMNILRSGETVFTGKTTLAELKRDPKELVEYLFRDNSFPQGACLMTGTGIVPNDEFTLQSGDKIQISIEGIGTLENVVV
jgi:2-dehydro-3-deoxy-D-arabinonate dehydratase